MKFKISLLLFLLTNITLFAQVKIGNNPNAIDSNSVLELESPDKVLVITKMNTTTMNSTTPLKGALVYNTDENCVFSYNGTIWRSLCQTASFITDNTPPTDNNTGDFWIDSSSGNIMNIWNGLSWIPINSKIKTGTGIPDNITAPNPIAGDVYIDVATAKTYTYNTATSSWVTQTSTNTGTSVEVTTANTAPTTNNNKGDFWINDTAGLNNPTSIYDGTTWVLLNSTSTNTQNPVKVINNTTAPANPNNGDFWVNPTTNETKIWDGTTSTWVLLNGNPKKGTGIPTDTTAPNSVAGDIYVDIATGTIYAYTGTAWITQTNTNTQNPVIASNGLTIDDTTDPTKNNIQLGGKLLSDTTIDTDGKAFAIKNLQTGDITNDDIVTIDRTTGELKKVTLNTVLKQEVTKLTATADQLDFTITLKSEDKINVYRNGVRVDFTINPAKTGITLEPNAKCYAGDQIRIVQLY
ncbi:hypothetical protein [Tenacibaculum piscium]|uniref:hypothetical protein n=1 Tax=Tenacibaculum piscium TaxID=1458515 RepID=UPI001F2299B1|nr:hypothetical protein [Tenacibaculum piscium]